MVFSIPKGVDPTQANRIITESLLRELRYIPSSMRSFQVPTLSRLRKESITKSAVQRKSQVCVLCLAPVLLQTNLLVATPTEIEALWLSSASLQRRLDRGELSNIHLKMPEKVNPATRVGTAASTVSMSEIRSVVSGVRSSTCENSSLFPVDVPTTASGAYGWVLGANGTSSWRRPKITREIVRYSEKYFAQNGYNPYQKKKSMS